MRNSGGGDRSGRWLVWVAVGVWVYYAIVDSWALGTPVPMPWFWSASGLALMLAMKAILDRAPVDRLRRAMVFVIAPIAAALLQSAIDVGITETVGAWALANVPEPPDGILVSPLGQAAEWVFKINFRTYFWLYGFYAAIMALTTAQAAEHAAREDGLTARLEAQRAELTALRLKVDPHYLFNALNSLSALIKEGRIHEAQELTLGLGQHYRASFVVGDSDLVALEDEIDDIRDYVDLLRFRAPGIRLDIDAPADILNLPVPSRILLPLVENAVKYGAVGKAEATISLVAGREGDALVIRIGNPLSPTPDPAGTGVGIATTRRRLQTLHGAAASLESVVGDGRWVSVVRLPFPMDEAGADR